MGSCMSGNHGRRTDADFTDKLFGVDLLAWRRKEWLRPGSSAFGMCEIPQPSGGTLNAYCECDLGERNGSLRVRFDFLPELVVELGCTSQPIGGVRWWLVCP